MSGCCHPHQPPVTTLKASFEFFDFPLSKSDSDKRSNDIAHHMVQKMGANDVDLDQVLASSEEKAMESSARLRMLYGLPTGERFQSRISRPSASLAS